MTDSDSSDMIVIKNVIELSQDIAALYLNKKFSDVEFVLESETYPAHKTILATRCKYFEETLYFEGKATSEETVSVSYTSPEAFQSLLKYIYTGVITLESRNINIILDLISVTNQYEMMDLRNTISKKLEVFISKTNVEQIFPIAKLFSLKDLKNACETFMKQNGIKVPLEEPDIPAQ